MTINDNKTTIDQEATDNTKKDDFLTKLQNHFYREKITRLTAKDFTIQDFKNIDAFLQEGYDKKNIIEIKELALKHLENYEVSISAKYCLGLIAIKDNSLVDIRYIKQVFDQFQESGKWVLLESLANTILETTPDNRMVLRIKLNALKKLEKSKKECLPVLKQLVQIDKKDAFIHLEYADLIADDDLDESISSYKQATEIFAKNLDIEKLKISWNKLVEFIPEDRAFFEKVERILRGLRQKEIIADLYGTLALYFIRKNNFDKIIFYCKKILEFNPTYNRFKTALIEAYKEKYKSHSLLETFLKYSGLLDTRRNIQTAIQSFETNVVLDQGNYVFHRTWGVGKIAQLNTEDIVIHFKKQNNENDERRMDMQLALKSLKPLTENHIWILKHEKPEEIKDLFANNKIEFFKILLKSFDNEISMAALKEEVIGFFIQATEWSKWWNKSKAEIIKDKLIAVSTKKKDIIELRDTPISLSEEAIEKFQLTQTYEDRIEIALDLIKKMPESNDALEYIQPSIKDALKSIDLQTQLECIFIYETISKISDSHREMNSEYEIIKNYLTDIENRIKKLSVKDASNLGLKLKEIDIKRRYSKILRENHPEWKKIYIEFLAHLPIKIHKDIVKELIEEQEFDILNDFFNKVKNNLNDYAEVSLWFFKSFINGTLPLENIFSSETLLNFFRVTRMLHRIEPKGTKLKNMAKDLVIGEGQEKILEFIDLYAISSVRKIVSLFKDISFISDKDKDKFLEILHTKYKEQFNEENSKVSHTLLEEMIIKSESTGFGIASSNAIDRMKKELERILKIEIPQNSHEIGEAQEKGDLRENAEYKAAMEKQAMLQATVTKLESEVKSLISIAGAVIPKDKISIGSKIKLSDGNDTFVYTIMDRWDADMDRGIISYKSPLGQVLLNKKVGDKVNFNTSTFDIVDLSVAINENGFLI